jgi:hypothetical protein
LWLRRLGMPLADVGAVLKAPAAERLGQLTAFWEAAEDRFAMQRHLAGHVGDLLSGHQGGYAMSHKVLTREVPAQLVLTEQRHISPEELGGWIGAAMGRLYTAAGPAAGTAEGEPVAPALVIYHGEVNHDSDGPVEVCVPIDRSAADSIDAAMREEPAHREAYVRITKAQVAFPQILSAFEAVTMWLDDQKLTPAGAPREVYFTDFMAAGPDEEVCDIAFPM